MSSLELFYDLVYVAVISEAAHHLAEHVSLRATGEFAVVFSLIWIAWVNGSLYVEIHGREDGRTRVIVFGQMTVLALLAVFTADAAGDSGPAFAIVYAIFLAIVTLLFFAVRRQDRQDRPEFVAEAGWYVGGMAAATAVMLASSFLPAGPRLIVWAAVAIGWIIGIMVSGAARVGFHRGLPPTESLVERFGLFTIIVLGEVVFGVVGGLSTADHTVKTIATGVFALWIGFGLWWVYFDLVGRRLPRNDSHAVVNWLLSHLPITMSIAAAGAAMVSLIAHAHDARTPAGTAWLLTGAVGLGLVAVVVTELTLVDAQRLVSVYQPLSLAMGAGAAAAVAVGWARPAPWLLALAMGAILSVLWFFAVSRFLRAGGSVAA